MALIFNDIKISGNTGNKVKVELIDTNTNQFLTKELTSNHEVPTREIIPNKHGSLKEILNELENEYPEIIFNTYKYGGIKAYPDKKVEDVEDVAPNSRESFIIRAKMKDRAQRKKLTYKFANNKKQLFITNTEKNAASISKTYDSEEEAQTAYNHYVTTLKGKIPEEDISIREKTGKHFIQILTQKRNIKHLDSKEFLIQRYESEKITDKKELEQLLEKLEKFSQPDKIDKFSVVETLNKKRKKQYHVILSSTSEKEIQTELEKHNLFLKKDMHGNPEILSRLKLYDPFNLNSPTTQLRNKFPIYSEYDSSKELDEQIHIEQNPLSEKDLEARIDSVFKTYKENTCSIDLEVIDYTDEIPSGRIYMAVLNSEKENNLYITKEAWRNQTWKERLEKTLSEKNVTPIFLEDEIELIAKLNKDAEKYRYVMGHNIIKYDYEHLSKFNNTGKLESRIAEINSKLFKIYQNFNEKEQKRFGLIEEAKKIAKDLKRIEEVKKQYNIKKSTNLWTKSKQQILDTYPYTKNRITLLGNSKLATITGFDKSLNYKEITRKIKSEIFQDFLDVCNYTIEDGEESTKATNLLLKNAILESALVNKPVQTVFNTDPVMLHYEAGDRNYEITTGTYSKRHERNFTRFIERLKARKSLPQIMKKMMSPIATKSGEIKGDLIYPTVLFDTFQEIITKNTVAKYIYESAIKEKNIMIKEDLLSKLEYYLRIPLDKARSYMEAKNLTFGEDYDVEKIYNFWNADPENVEKEYHKKIVIDKTPLSLKLGDSSEPEQKEYLSDYKFNQANMIFSIQYGAKFFMVGTPFNIRLNAVIPVKSAIIKYNLKQLQEAEIQAKSDNFIVSNDSTLTENSKMNFGNIKGMATKDWFIGTISDGNRTYEIYQNIRKPNIPLIQEAITSFLNQKTLPLNDLQEKYKEVDDETKNKITSKEKMALKMIYGTDPLALEQPTLFDL